MKLKKGDTVTVTVGKDRGKTEKIEKVLIKEDKIIVTGVNRFKRHLKARAAGKPSEIVTITKAISVANVSLVCPNCKKLTRIGYGGEKGKKMRVCRKCKKEI
ncbi:MAG: 50S ribosomal protein L24 [Candidatus Levybacteria bacterium]|nr:50S ribosomal protein L24 [Candidatus Levybacteria bacterium]